MKTTFTADALTMNGKTFPASYSVTRSGDVYIFTTVTTADEEKPAAVRLHIGKDHPLHAAALAAAKPETAAAPAEVKPAAEEKKPEAPAAEEKKPAKKPAARKAKKPAEVKPAAEEKKPAEVKPAEVKPEEKPAAAPVVGDKSFIGSALTGNGWQISFDAAAQRTRVTFTAEPTEAQKASVTAAGFFWSSAMKSYNKRLTCKAHRAAVALAAQLSAIA